MPHNTASYFEERAEEELELAQRATHPKAVKAHYDLAGFYLDRVHGAPETEPQQPSEQPLGEEDCAS
jgi:hypothetical protein